MNKKRPFLSTGIFVVIGRAGGLIMPFIIARLFGANDKTDAFFFANTIIVAITAFFTPVFESVLVPEFSKHKNNPSHISDLANGATWVSLPLVFLLSLAIWAALPWILTHGSGLNAATARLVSRHFVEMFGLLLFGIWVAASGSVFYAHQSFWFPAVSPIFRFIFTLGFTFVFYRTLGIHSVSIGYSIGEVLRWGLGLGILSKLNFWKIQTRWNQIKDELKNLFKQTSVQMLAFVAINVIPLTDQFFASFLGAGQVSLLNYATRLFQIPFQFCLVGMLQIFLSDWAAGFHEENREALWKRVRRDIRIVLILGLLLSAVSWIARGWIVRMMFGYSHLSDEQMKIVADVFGWLILGFAPAVLHLMYVRILFVTKQSKVFFLQAWLKLLMNIVFNYLCMRIWGLKGIAISSTLVFSVTAFWLHVYAKKNIFSQERKLKS